jgi:hypothetical protein
MDSLEDDVDCVISVSAVPPSFDDPHVVAVDNNVLWCLEERVDSVNQELESDRFSPTDVSLCSRGFPTWDEAPGSPSVAAARLIGSQLRLMAALCLTWLWTPNQVIKKPRFQFWLA